MYVEEGLTLDPDYIKFDAEPKAQCVECGEILLQPLTPPPHFSSHYDFFGHLFRKMVLITLLTIRNGP